MQISRRFLIACVSAGFLCCPALPAADTDAQIKAREALERSLNQSPPSGMAPAGATQVAPAPAWTEPPPASIQTAAQTPPSLGAPTPSTPEQIEKAREALRQQMMQSQSSAPAVRTTPAPAVAPATPQPRSVPAPPVAQPAPVRRAAPVAPTLAAPTASTPEQIEQAREALRRQLMQAQPSTPAAPVTPPPVVAPAIPQPRPVQAPAVAQPAPVRPPAATIPTLDGPTASTSEQIEKAREALRQSMQGTASATPTTPVTPRPLPQVTQPATPFMAAPATASTPESVEKAREALQQKMRELESQQPPTATPGTPSQWAQPSRPAVPAQPAHTGFEFPPVPAATDPQAVEKAREALRGAMPPPQVKVRPGSSAPQGPQGPPTGLSADKEERLHELLRRYRADELTPDEYHAERARILAAP